MIFSLPVKSSTFSELVKMKKIFSLYQAANMKPKVIQTEATLNLKYQHLGKCKYKYQHLLLKLKTTEMLSAALNIVTCI